MKDGPKVLAVICARGGSKRLPNKNMLPIGAAPMVYYSILAAKQSEHIDEVVVSTDSQEIGEYCKGLGAGWIRRSPDISGDNADIKDAVREAADLFVGVDLVVTLQAAVPFRPAGMIDALIDEVISSGSNGGLSLVRAAPWTWNRYSSGTGDRMVASFDFENYPRSQDLPETFQEVNAVQVAPIDFVRQGRRWGSPLSVVVMPEIFAVDIDTEEDLQEARERWSMIKNFYFGRRDFVTFTEKNLVKTFKG